MHRLFHKQNEQTEKSGLAEKVNSLGDWVHDFEEKDKEKVKDSLKQYNMDLKTLLLGYQESLADWEKKQAEVLNHVHNNNNSSHDMENHLLNLISDKLQRIFSKMQESIQLILSAETNSEFLQFKIAFEFKINLGKQLITSLDNLAKRFDGQNDQSTLVTICNMSLIFLKTYINHINSLMDKINSLIQMPSYPRIPCLSPRTPIATNAIYTCKEIFDEKQIGINKGTQDFLQKMQTKYDQLLVSHMESEKQESNQNRVGYRP